MLKIPEFDNLDVICGAKLSTYPQMKDIPEEFRNRYNRFSEIASALFHRGGTLAMHGLQFRTGVPGTAMRAIKAWLCSFEPAHEHKIATVAYALSEWCENCSREEPAQKEARKAARVKKSKKASKKAFKKLKQEGIR